MNRYQHIWYVRKKNSRYKNPHSDHEPESLLFGTLPSFLKSLIARWYQQPLDLTKWLKKDIPIERSHVPSITWIGHATFLIQIAGKNIITDPIFYQVLPFFKRLLPLGIELDKLPPIDYVLISHNHWDHMDAATLYWLKNHYSKMQILVPEGNKKWFLCRGFTHVTEYTWWQHGMSEDVISFTFLPAIHWSGRGLFDTNKTLWGSWMISSADFTFYFAGDTAFGNHFEYIAQKFKNIDCALLPIAPGQPHEWMKRTHMNSSQALDAFSLLQARHFIPMHWGTFQFGYDQGEQPLQQLLQSWQLQEKTTNKFLHVPKIGERLSFDNYNLLDVAQQQLYHFATNDGNIRK